MSQIKQGFSLIGKGIVTALRINEISKFYRNSKQKTYTKIRQFFSPQIHGWQSIHLGLQTIFGVSPEQKIEKEAIRVCSDLPYLNTQIAKQLIKNAIRNRDYYSEANKDIAQDFDIVALTADCLQKLYGFSLVGIHAMAGPVDFVSVRDQASSTLSITHSLEAMSRRLAAKLPLMVYSASSIDQNYKDGIASAFVENASYEFNNEILYNLNLLALSVSWDQKVSLYDMIKKEALAIGKRSHRSAANWVLLNPDHLVQLQLDRTVEWAPQDSTVPPSGFASGSLSPYRKLLIEKGPTPEQNKYAQVYLNIISNTGSDVLLGYKGATESDTGFIFAPYSLLQPSGAVVDTTTFDPVMTFMTRYGQYTSAEASNFYTKLVPTN